MFSHKKTKNFVEDISLFLSSFGDNGDYAYRRKLLKDMDSDEFLVLILATCALVREGENNVPTSFDGHYRGAISGGVPLKEDKVDCLIETWNVAKKFIDDDSLNDFDSLLYAVATIYNGMLLTHPFIDSNGRTTRVLTYGLLNGKADENYIRKALLARHGGKDKDRWNLDASMTFQIFDKESFSGWQPDFIEPKYFTMKDINIGEHVVRMFIEKHSNDSLISLINKFVEDADGKEVFKSEAFIRFLEENCTQDQIDKIFQELDRLGAREHLRGFLNAMQTEKGVVVNLKNTEDSYAHVSSNYGYDEDECLRERNAARRFLKIDESVSLTDSLYASLPLRQQLIVERAYTVEKLVPMEIIEKENTI